MFNYFYQRFVKDFLDHLFFPALMIAGILATKITSPNIIIPAVFVNYLLMVVAFMYNDIEDRIEDAKSPGKRFKNPFGYNVMSLEDGYILAALLSIVALSISYYLGGTKLVAIAISNILIGVLYSYKKIRFKSVPFIDLLSHAYMLATVQILYFMYLPQASNAIGTYLILAGVTFISIGGSLRNQERDYYDDKKAKIQNTASIIGKETSQILTKLFWSTGAAIAFLGIIK